MVNTNRGVRNHKKTLKASRRVIKALILLGVFAAAFSVTGGLGIIAALSLLGLWLFLDIQDSTPVSAETMN